VKQKLDSQTQVREKLGSRIEVTVTYKLRGKVRVIVRDANTNEVLQVVEANNLIVDVGKSHICDLMIGDTTAYFNYCAVGSGTTAPTSADTALEAEITPRKTVTDSFRTANKATWSTFFGTADNNGTWNECGLFTASTGGVMLCRALFPSTITKDETKTITVDWEVTIT